MNTKHLATLTLSCLLTTTAFAQISGSVDSGPGPNTTDKYQWLEDVSSDRSMS